MSHVNEGEHQLVLAFLLSCKRFSSRRPQSESKNTDTHRTRYQCQKMWRCRGVRVELECLGIHTNEHFHFGAPCQRLQLGTDW